MYKNYTKELGIPLRLREYIAKILLIMRLTTLLMIISLVQVSAATLAQKLSLNKNNAPLKTVLKDIRSQSGYDFIITESLLEEAKPVTINIKDTELKDALEQIFKDQKLTYSINKTTITIKEKPASLLDNVKAVFSTFDVHGRVMDQTGKPLPGVTVKVKGGNQATITDANGEFVLKGIDGDAILVLTFIGFVPKEIAAKDNLNNIGLEVSSAKLDEVQVIAYGQTSRRLSTGDISTVKSADISRQVTTNPLLAIQASIPGLFITQSTGVTNGNITVRIQGQNSIGNGSDPLYIVDGIPYPAQMLPTTASQALGGAAGSAGNPFSYLNPKEIESIDVLKDADATAIYGSRAANGAILITTKKGKAGQMQTDINIQQGYGEVGRFVKMMNTQQFLAMRHEALENDGISSPASTDYDINGTWNANKYTDWQKVLFGGTASYTDVNAGISGGTAFSQYRIGGLYHHETSVFTGNSGTSKGGMHFSSTNRSANGKFTANFSGSYQGDFTNLPTADLTSVAFLLAPNAPDLYNVDGSLNWAPTASGTSTWNNPLKYTKNNYSNRTQSLISSLDLGYQLTKELSFKTTFGYNSLNTKEVTTNPLSGIRPDWLSFSTNAAIYTRSEISSWSIEPQFNYNNFIGSGKLDILVGASLQRRNSNGEGLIGNNYTSDELLEDMHSAASLRSSSVYATIYRYNAGFGRVSYNWKDKYIINLNARRDGTSRFGEKNQFHNFASVGAAYIISEEAFFKNTLPFVSFAKLRGSFGTTGNDQIPDYQFMSLYQPINAGVGYQGASGLYANRLTNPYLQWEETKKTQFGLDLGFAHDRLLLNVNYNINKSSNQLLDYNLPAITGFNGITTNFAAKVQNTAFEFTLSSINIQSEKFSWRTTANITIPRNKLVAFPNLATSSYSDYLIIGKSINVQKLFKYAGVDPQTGVYQFYSHDGSITQSPDYATDRTAVVDLSPKFYGGFENSLTYKGFDLIFQFRFVKQKAAGFRFGNTIGYRQPGGFMFNQPVALLDNWKKPGDKSDYQKFSSDYSLLDSYYNAQSSDANIEDASFIRLKNVSLGWSLPEKTIQLIGVKSAKIYFQGQNLLTISGFSGIDPEAISALPPLRIWTIGIQAGF